MILNLTYMSGAGNIFTVLDNRKNNLEQTYYSSITQKLCSKDYNSFLNTEGLLVLNNPSGKNKFDIMFFNPDGSFSMMCGNGARCAVRFAEICGLISNSIERNDIIFKMQSTVYKATLNGDNIEIKFPPAIEIKNNIQIKLNDSLITGAYVNVGSDHFVIPITEFNNIGIQALDDLDIYKYGSLIRHHDKFPRGVNADFYELNREGIIRIRTYERGVEAETGACGTGAIATALIAHINHKTPFPTTLIPTSGIPIKVDIYGIMAKAEYEIYLSGPAVVIGNNQIEI